MKMSTVGCSLRGSGSRPLPWEGLASMTGVGSRQGELLTVAATDRSTQGGLPISPGWFIKSLMEDTKKMGDLKVLAHLVNKEY